MVLPGLEDDYCEEEEIITLLKKHNVNYVDKRSSRGGALWIIGGDELKPIVTMAHMLGVDFKFKKGGGRSSKGKDAWWTK